MSTVTFPVELGGDGQTYTDGSDPTTGLAQGGHQTRFVPCLAGAVAMAQSAADSAASGHQQNVFLNGTMEIWNDPGTVSCAAGSKTSAHEGWYIQPTGAAVNRSRSTTVRTGARSRYSCELAGATSVTTVLFGTRLEAAQINDIARQVTFQIYVYNGSGGAFSPVLLLGTPAATDDFTTVTNRLTQTLQSCPDATWTLVSHTVDISAYTNLANGLQVEFQVPSGSLVAGDTVRFAEAQLKAQATVSPLYAEPLSINQVRCGRFFQKSFFPDTAPISNVGVDSGETQFPAYAAGASALRSQQVVFAPIMRAAPTMALYNPGSTGTEARDINASVNCSSTAASAVTRRGFVIAATGNASTVLGNRIGLHWTANARLF